MPITKTTQARIDLSADQVGLIVESVWPSMERFHTPMLSVEETNLEGVIALKTKRGITLVSHDAQVTHLGKGAYSRSEKDSE
jgi:hypothetical protein